MIAPLIKWEHSEDWFVTKFELQRSTRSGERKIKIGLSDQDYDFIVGHAIDGNVSCFFRQIFFFNENYAFKNSIVYEFKIYSFLFHI